MNSWVCVLDKKVEGQSWNWLYWMSNGTFQQQQLSLFPQECVLNYRLEPLGLVEGFTAEVGASGSFCPSHLTLPVDVSFYSVSDDNAPSPYMVRSRWLIRNSVFFFQTAWLSIELKAPCVSHKSICVLLVCLLVTRWLCPLTGCDKPGVPGQKGLPSTSIRNHSSGEEVVQVTFYRQKFSARLKDAQYGEKWPRTKSKVH